MIEGGGRKPTEQRTDGGTRCRQRPRRADVNHEDGEVSCALALAASAVEPGPFAKIGDKLVARASREGKESLTTSVLQMA